MCTYIRVSFIAVLFSTVLCAQTAAVDIPLTITDGAAGNTTLRFGLDPTATDGIDAALGEQPLPPMPPTGVFDTRFNLPASTESSLKDYRTGTANFVGQKIHEIQYQVGTGTTIQIGWTLPTGVTGRLQDVILGTIIDVNMTGTGNYTVTNPGAINKLKMTVTYDLGSVITPPPAPTLVSPANNATNQPTALTLTWNAATGAVTYRVQVSTSNAFTTTIVNDSTVTGTTKQISGLLNSTTYYWRVNAKNTAGTSSYSPVYQFTTTAGVVAPPAPTLATPANNATNQPTALTLTWNAATGAETYRVQVSTSNTFTTTIVNDSTVTGTTKQISGLLNSTTYYWRVNAKNTAGTSVYSPVYQFTTTVGVVVPPAPTLATPANNATNQPTALTLTWNAATGAETYRVQVSTSNTFTTTIVNDSTVMGTTKQISGLLNSTTYYWRVNAKNTAGTGEWSPTWYFTTVTVPRFVVLANPPKSAINQPVNLTFTWYKAIEQKTILKYWFEVVTDTIFMNGVIRDTMLTDTMKSVTGLQYGTYYYWRVKAKNEAGWGSFNTAVNDKWWRFRTVVSDVPAVPVLLTPINGAVNQPVTLTLSWEPAAGAQTYRVQVSASNTFASTVADDSTMTATSKTISGLSNGTTYYWRVRAANQTATSAFSQVFSFITAPVITVPAVPVLLAPINGAVNQPVTLTLSWEPAAGA